MRNVRRTARIGTGSENLSTSTSRIRSDDKVTLEDEYLFPIVVHDRMLPKGARVKLY